MLYEYKEKTYTLDNPNKTIKEEEWTSHIHHPDEETPDVYVFWGKDRYYYLLNENFEIIKTERRQHYPPFCQPYFYYDSNKGNVYIFTTVTTLYLIFSNWCFVIDSNTGELKETLVWKHGLVGLNCFFPGAFALGKKIKFDGGYDKYDFFVSEDLKNRYKEFLDTNLSTKTLSIISGLSTFNMSILLTSDILPDLEIPTEDITYNNYNYGQEVFYPLNIDEQLIDIYNIMKYHKDDKRIPNEMKRNLFRFNNVNTFNIDLIPVPEMPSFTPPPANLFECMMATSGWSTSHFSATYSTFAIETKHNTLLPSITSNNTLFICETLSPGITTTASDLGHPFNCVLSPYYAFTTSKKSGFVILRINHKDGNCFTHTFESTNDLETTDWFLYERNNIFPEEYLHIDFPFWCKHKIKLEHLQFDDGALKISSPDDVSILYGGLNVSFKYDNIIDYPTIDKDNGNIIYPRQPIARDNNTHNPFLPLTPTILSRSAYHKNQFHASTVAPTEMIFCDLDNYQIIQEINDNEVIFSVSSTPNFLDLMTEKIREGVKNNVNTVSFTTYSILTTLNGEDVIEFRESVDNFSEYVRHDKIINIIGESYQRSFYKRILSSSYHFLTTNEERNMYRYLLYRAAMKDSKLSKIYIFRNIVTVDFYGFFDIPKNTAYTLIELPLPYIGGFKWKKDKEWFFKPYKITDLQINTSTDLVEVLDVSGEEICFPIMAHNKEADTHLFYVNDNIYEIYTNEYGVVSLRRGQLVKVNENNETENLLHNVRIFMKWNEFINDYYNKIEWET